MVGGLTVISLVEDTALRRQSASIDQTATRRKSKCSDRKRSHTDRRRNTCTRANVSQLCIGGMSCKRGIRKCSAAAQFDASNIDIRSSTYLYLLPRTQCGLAVTFSWRASIARISTRDALSSKTETPQKLSAEKPNWHHALIVYISKSISRK